MKKILLVFLLLVFAKEGYMSGEGKDIELSSRLDKRRNVYVVKIIGSSSVAIKEIKKASKDPTAADKSYYSAQIIEIINRGPGTWENEEEWTMLFSKKENSILAKIRKNGISGVKVHDTIFIMDAEDLSYSYIYEVEGRHKIFYYYHCADVAEKINNGETYLFIGDASVSKKNGVFYGNIDYGLYPNTKSMRDKIEGILKTSRH
jgi:hypothetical protein